MSFFRRLTCLLTIGALLPSLCHSCPAEVEPWQQSFIAHISHDWSKWRVTELFSRKPRNLSFLDDAVGPAALGDATSTSICEFIVGQPDDAEGGYDLGIIRLVYPDAAIATTAWANQGKKPNLMGSKLFVGYTAKQCNNAVVVFFSKAAATAPVQHFFEYVQHHRCPWRPSEHQETK